jgi:hypothetical protein
MDYRSAYIRRSRKGVHLKQRLAAIGLLGVAGCATLCTLAMRSPAAPATQVQAQAAGNAAAPAPAVLQTAARAETNRTRRVYPYSIVPGGVTDRRELARAVMDKVVATHYAAFEMDKASIRTVDKPRAVYVSYRKGDKVYWTAKKLQLAKGETLLSDGQNEIRTRCGNRISDVPRLPVEAKGPSEEELDSSVEQAREDAGEGDMEEVGFAVDENPAGQGFQLQTFASSAAQNGGAAPALTAGVTGFGSGIPGATWTGGGVPLYLVSGTSSDTAGSGTGSGGSGTGAPGGAGTVTGTGAPGTGDPGTKDPGTGGSATGGSQPGGSSGTQLPTTLDDTVLPSTDPGTKPPPSIPGTLLPPSSDLPGHANDPGKNTTMPGNAPEPGSLWLGGAGVAALLAARRRRPRG